MDYKFNKGDKVIVTHGPMFGLCGTVVSNHIIYDNNCQPAYCRLGVKLDDYSNPITSQGAYYFSSNELALYKEGFTVVSRNNCKTLLNSFCGRNPYLPSWLQSCTNNRYNVSSISEQINKVIFNAPATIVFWNDGSKTVVKCNDKETYDKEKGLAMAIVKKFSGNKGNYYNVFSKFITEDSK